jgi:uncharacterized protein (DUF433 family)
MTLPDFLRRGPLGEIRFAGSRIDLYHVIVSHNEGWPAEAIALRYDSVRLAHVRQAIDFYHANRQDVDEYVRGVEAKVRELEAALPRVDVAKLRERVDDLQQEPTAAGG